MQIGRVFKKYPVSQTVKCPATIARFTTNAKETNSHFTPQNRSLMTRSLLYSHQLLPVNHRDLCTRRRKDFP